MSITLEVLANIIIRVLMVILAFIAIDYAREAYRKKEYVYAVLLLILATLLVLVKVSLDF